MNIGLEIKKRREARGLSQEAFGQMLGISGQQVSNIERGYGGVAMKHREHVKDILGISGRLLMRASLDAFRKRISMRK